MARDQAAGPEAKPLRLFVAVDVPAGVKDRLDEVVQPFRTRIPGARWTRRDGWHVTLKFLGATWPRLVPAVQEAVRTAASASASFRSSVTELGCFPSRTRARVLWAGLDEGHDGFGALARGLDDLLEEHFTPEARAFTPHLTVARLVPPRNLGEFVPDLVGTRVDSAPFDVDRLVLYRSHLSPAGARYEPVFEARLGDA